VKDSFESQIMVGIAVFALVVGFVIGLGVGGSRGVKAAPVSIAADLAVQGYTLQRVETPGEGAQWVVAER
jgi:predicted transporter